MTATTTTRDYVRVYDDAAAVYPQGYNAAASSLGARAGLSIVKTGRTAWDVMQAGEVVATASKTARGYRATLTAHGRDLGYCFDNQGQILDTVARELGALAAATVTTPEPATPAAPASPVTYTNEDDALIAPWVAGGGRGRNYETGMHGWCPVTDADPLRDADLDALMDQPTYPMPTADQLDAMRASDDPAAAVAAYCQSTQPVPFVSDDDDMTEEDWEKAVDSTIIPGCGCGCGGDTLYDIHYHDDDPDDTSTCDQCGQPATEDDTATVRTGSHDTDDQESHEVTVCQSCRDENESESHGTNRRSDIHNLSRMGADDGRCVDAEQSHRDYLPDVDSASDLSVDRPAAGVDDAPDPVAAVLKATRDDSVPLGPEHYPGLTFGNGDGGLIGNWFTDPPITSRHIQFVQRPGIQREPETEEPELCAEGAHNRVRTTSMRKAHRSNDPVAAVLADLNAALHEPTPLNVLATLTPVKLGDEVGWQRTWNALAATGRNSTEILRDWPMVENQTCRVFIDGPEGGQIEDLPFPNAAAREAASQSPWDDATNVPRVNVRTAWFASLYGAQEGSQDTVCDECGAPCLHWDERTDGHTGYLCLDCASADNPTPDDDTPPDGPDWPVPLSRDDPELAPGPSNTVYDQPEPLFKRWRRTPSRWADVTTEEPAWLASLICPPHTYDAMEWDR